MMALWKTRRDKVIRVLVGGLLMGILASWWLVMVTGVESTGAIVAFFLIGTPVIGIISILLGAAIAGGISRGAQPLQFSDDQQIHPNSGLPMNGGIDLAGNTIGDTHTHNSITTSLDSTSL